MNHLRVCCVAFVLAACSKPEVSAPAIDASRPVARVRVFVDNHVTIDDATVSIEGMKRAFADLKARDGIVWYFRENGDARNAPPIAKEVINEVIANKLEIALSSKADFSEMTATARPPTSKP